MIRTGYSFDVVFILVASAMVPQTAWGGQVVVEGTPLAQRVIMVDPTALGDPAAVDTVHRQLRDAARAVCNEQYPRETSYYFSRACSSGSFRDALERLAVIKAQLTARPNAPRHVAISVRAR